MVLLRDTHGKKDPNMGQLPYRPIKTTSAVACTTNRNGTCLFVSMPRPALRPPSTTLGGHNAHKSALNCDHLPHNPRRATNRQCCSYRQPETTLNQRSYYCFYRLFCPSMVCADMVTDFVITAIAIFSLVCLRRQAVRRGLCPLG